MPGKKNEEIEDPIEKMLTMVRDNAEVFEILMKIMDRLERGGVKETLKKIADGAIPSDANYLFEFFTSEPMLDSILKGGNLVLLLMHALTDEHTSDSIKALAGNVSYIAESAASYAEGNEKLNVLKLYSVIKDPDISFAIMTMMGALKASGRILKDLKKEKKMIESLEE